MRQSSGVLSWTEGTVKENVASDIPITGVLMAPPDQSMEVVCNYESVMLRNPCKGVGDLAMCAHMGPKNHRDETFKSNIYLEAIITG